MKKRVYPYIVLIMLFLLTGCTGKDWDSDSYGPEPKDRKSQENSATVEEKPNLAEMLVEERLLLPKKEDLVGKWEGFVIYDYANSDMIDLEDSDVDLAFEFYLNGDQLMVKMLDSVAPVEYEAYEDSRVLSFAFTIISDAKQVGVDAPPVEMSFSNSITWKRPDKDGEYVLQMLKDGKFRWEWGGLVTVGKWEAEKL
jgi:hypothetical protein